MNQFKLDPQLEKDCYRLGRLQGQHLLLLNNNLVPWFVLVPETDVTELYLLEESEQQLLLLNMRRISAFLEANYSFDKLNVASIGNIVSQLHLHIIARSKTDFCWPDVVWGRPEKNPYSDTEIDRIKVLLEKMFARFFVVS